MSWLRHPERDFKYCCPQCHEVTIVTLRPEDESYREPIPCDCGGMAAYDSFLPIQMNLRGRVAFEQNGRKAYVVSDGKGGVRYVSATKHHYQETGDIVPKYTRAYEEHLRKTGHEDQLESSKHADLVRERRASQQRSKQIKEALTHQQLKKDIKNEP